MKQYRIKIVEKNNGEFDYIPQFGNMNIIHQRDIFFEKTPFLILSKSEEIYQTEQEALDIINIYKDQQNRLEGFYTKNITYKNII